MTERGQTGSDEPQAARRFSPVQVRRIILAAVTLVTLYGALIRLDALTVRYGWLDHPAWAVRIEQSLLPVSMTLRPAAVPWLRVDRPYEGGDPINYLRFAREMRHFYQAHVREPVFLALTRFMLWVMADSDIAVSYASLIGGTLAIVATFLLGRAAHSTVAGLIAAAALAIELEAVIWAADGWRDDTFMFFVALSGWSFLRLYQEPSWRWGLAAGAIGAGACLTRISSLSFIVPMLVWIVFETWRAGARQSGPAVRRSLRFAGVAAVVTGLLVLPFLINCWRATGDPFFAINYHTRYYRAAEGLPLDESVGVFDYIGRKLHDRPVATIDTAAVGLFVFPFKNKWGGFRAWSPALMEVLRWSAIVGLILGLMFPAGRLLWVLMLTSLAPYALTWSLGGGGEWRFTQHVYPIYLVAAGASLAAAFAAVRRAATRRIDWEAAFKGPRLKQVAVCAAATAVGWLLYVAFPYLVLREALVAGETVSVPVSDRDFIFFPTKWSQPNGSGNVIVRVAEAEQVSIRLPLPRPVEHTLTLRMDGPQLPDPMLQPRVTVFLNKRAVAQVRFKDDPTRVGAYRFTIPRDMAGRMFNRLDLVSSHTIPAEQCGPRFAWLPGDTPVAFYLWYIRVEPHEIAGP
jgi:hypothetical protein